MKGRYENPGASRCVGPNGTSGLVSQWERGDKRPGSAPLKLLNLFTKKRL